MDGPKAVSLANLSRALTMSVEAMDVHYGTCSGTVGPVTFAYFECVLGADWPGSVQSFV